ncbi:MAG TPA: hypothetical protein VFX49_08920 [Chloroflexota bacterium]|nr:hypothetical protein [Chloroflexota bacterium]
MRVAPMQIRFSKGKRADRPDVLTCLRADGSSTWMHERPGFVYHDLAHYAVETSLGYRYGFFGLVRSGWELSSADFGRDPVTKQRFPWPDPSGAPMEPVEYVVSLLQRERGGWGVTQDDFHDAMKLYVGDSRPQVPEERLAAARQLVRDLYARWEAVPPGEALDLTFAV